MAKKELKLSWLLCGSFIVSVGSSLLWPLTTIYMHNYLGQSLTTAGIVLFINSLALIAGSYLGGRMYDKDRKNARRWLLGALFLSTSAVFLLIFFNGWPTFAVLLLLDNFGGGIAITIENSLATNEVNAAMGLICATPTAGSSGTIPGVLFALQKKRGLTTDQMVAFLFCASAFGMVTANNAMIAGATGGCQAEVGSASGMAAAAAVEICGGSPTQAAEAFAMALSNLLGLVCDPVAGLVEIPCVKRNVVGSVNALAAADMALAGLENKIPADEVILAMKRIGKRLPAQLRETGLGGLAATPTGIKMKLKIFGEELELD